MCDICTLTAPLPAETVDIVERGVAEVFAASMQERRDALRMEIEWARSWLVVPAGGFVAGGGEC